MTSGPRVDRTPQDSSPVHSAIITGAEDGQSPNTYHTSPKGRLFHRQCTPLLHPPRDKLGRLGLKSKLRWRNRPREGQRVVRGHTASSERGFTKIPASGFPSTPFPPAYPRHARLRRTSQNFCPSVPASGGPPGLWSSPRASTGQTADPAHPRAGPTAAPGPAPEPSFPPPAGPAESHSLEPAAADISLSASSSSSSRRPPRALRPQKNPPHVPSPSIESLSFPSLRPKTERSPPPVGGSPPIPTAPSETDTCLRQLSRTLARCLEPSYNRAALAAPAPALRTCTETATGIQDPGSQDRSLCRNKGGGLSHGLDELVLHDCIIPRDSSPLPLEHRRVLCALRFNCKNNCEHKSTTPRQRLLPFLEPHGNYVPRSVFRVNIIFLLLVTHLL